MKPFDAGYLRLLHCLKCGWSGAGQPRYIKAFIVSNDLREDIDWYCQRCGYHVTTTTCADAE